MKQLIMFDIDATLLVTSGAGVKAMQTAGEALFGPPFVTDGLDFAGRIDPLLIAELLELNKRQVNESTMREFRLRYHSELHASAARAGGVLGRALPGVHELLAKLRSLSVAMGLLTGNFAETGQIKLRACGIDPTWFEPTVWGDDSPIVPPRRDHLPAVAMQRVQDRLGRPIAPDRVIIVGDTPHDIRCAQVNGCRSMGVATGKYSMDDLRRAGADHVVADLSQVDEMVKVLTTDVR